jgi:predicted ATPase/DNA-binding winged helix-turn-helix (wHTH) protein
MEQKKHISFGPFRLDEGNECLWRGSVAITLRPKVFAVLRYLIERPGQLVTKEQLLEALWLDTFVSDAVLKDSIRQIREALGDEAKAPQYIETLHRRGYRFIGQIQPNQESGFRIQDSADKSQESGVASPVSGVGGGAHGGAPVRQAGEADSGFSQPQAGEALSGSQPPIPPVIPSSSHPFTPSSLPPVIPSPVNPFIPPPAPTGVVGRESALAEMRKWLDRALQGIRQIAFVTGEAGIGKTTLVELFLQEVVAGQNIAVGRGQCLEQYGAGEAYLPVLDAFARLCRESGRGQVIEVLRRHAPTWLAQMPSLISTGERESLHQQLLGATRERMLREMAEAVEALTAFTPLVLVLEDLHWSDYSTLALISYLARRREPARLMVVATYRPVEVILSEHPLKGIKQELRMHRLCEELPLEYLTREAVKEFLAGRFPANQFPSKLVELIHQRTGGNPLFMSNMVDYLLSEKIIVEQQGEWQLQVALAEVELGVPENIRHLIEKQIERLSPEEQRVLEAASVVGLECSAVAIAAALNEDILRIEECCEGLARQHQFLSPPYIVELPDGTLTSRHKFTHILYLDVLYSRIALTRRSQMHSRISVCGETIYGEQVGEIAAELAVHFEQGRDWNKAIQYLLMAAENASRRFANYEALALARRGLELLHLLPGTAERRAQELSLRMIFGAALMAIKGFAAAEVPEVYRPAQELCQQQNDSLQLFKVLWSLGLFHLFRAELRESLAMAEQLLPIAERRQDSILMMEAHRALGMSLMAMGNYSTALEHLNESTFYESFYREPHFLLTGNNSKVMSLCFAGWSLWSLGFPDQALERINEGLAMAREHSHSQSLIAALYLATIVHQLRGEATLAEQRAEAVIALAQEQGLPMWAAVGTIYCGWAQLEQGQPDKGIELMQRGLAAYQATGAKLWRSHFLGLLAEGLAKAGQLEEAQRILHEALATAVEIGERYYEAELHRLKGELLVKQALPFEAEAAFKQAMAIAEQQQAKSLQLRAASSLSRLYETQGRTEEARQSLAELYQGFSEGLATADLRQARNLLNDLQ